MFVLSKVFWFLVNPANIIVVALVAGTALVYFPGSRRTGRRILAVTVLVLLAISVFPLGPRMIETLENRFPGNPVLPEQVAGIIVLGGSVNQHLTVARQQPALTEGAERLTEFIRLGYIFPQAKLVFSGGSGSIFDQSLKETAVARLFFEQMHFDADRVLYESESRNTHENATLSRDLVAPTPGETWVLVTSALHMPRAVGCFRQAGWNVIPYPVDYLTDGMGSFEAGFDPVSGLATLNRALHEWIGLAAYRLLGRTSALFPRAAEAPGAAGNIEQAPAQAPEAPPAHTGP
ncbi:MAG: YdcF family protein [Rhodospirillaceae bacterium]